MDMENKIEDFELSGFNSIWFDYLFLDEKTKLIIFYKCYHTKNVHVKGELWHMLIWNSSILYSKKAYYLFIIQD